jgi:hypothetical protein
MAIQLATTRGATGRTTRQRPMRNTRLVTLRSSLPTGLVTLRHDVPEYLTEATDIPQDAAPKVEQKGQAAVRVQVRIETPARKGS